MSAGSQATAALVLASSSCFRAAEILCTSSYPTPFPESLLYNSFLRLRRSERLEPEPPQPQSRPGRRSSAGVPHHTSRAPAPHTAAPEPAHSRHHRPRHTTNNSEVEVVVDAIFSAHSAGLMVILRHASAPSGGAQLAKPDAPAARPSK